LASSTEGSNGLQFSVRLCSDRAAYEVRLGRRWLDLETLVERAEASKLFVAVLKTRHLIVLRSLQGAEVTASSDGRMLVRRVSDEDEARQVASRLLSSLVTA
jgi:hypothetical protein